MRQYGRLRWDDAEYARLLGAHAAFFADLVERSWAGVRGHRNQEWLNLLDDQFGNIRAVFEKAILDSDIDVAVRISAGLFMYADERRRAEMSRWLELTIALPGVDAAPDGAPPPPTPGFSLTRCRGDLETANSELRRVLDGARR